MVTTKVSRLTHGFSLLEMMLVVAISAVIFGVMGTMFQTLNRSAAHIMMTQTKIDLQNQLAALIASGNCNDTFKNATPPIAFPHDTNTTVQITKLDLYNFTNHSDYGNLLAVGQPINPAFPNLTVDVAPPAGGGVKLDLTAAGGGLYYGALTINFKVAGSDEVIPPIYLPKVALFTQQVGSNDVVMGCNASGSGSFYSWGTNTCPLGYNAVFVGHTFTLANQFAGSSGDILCGSNIGPVAAYQMAQINGDSNGPPTGTVSPSGVFQAACAYCVPITGGGGCYTVWGQASCPYGNQVTSANAVMVGGGSHLLSNTATPVCAEPENAAFPGVGFPPQTRSVYYMQGASQHWAVSPPCATCCP